MNAISTSNILTFSRISMPQRYRVETLGMKEKLAGIESVVRKVYKKSIIADFWTVLSSPVL